MKKYGIKIKSIVKCNDKFLIVERWYDDRIEEPYQWEFLDTDLEDDELPETACMRVIAESTGINSARIVSMAYSWKYQLGDNNYLGLAFCVKFRTNRLCFRKNSEIISGLRLRNLRTIYRSRLS